MNKEQEEKLLELGRDNRPEYIGQPLNPEKPDLIKKFLRPDGTIVDLYFYKNQFGNYYVSSRDEIGGQRISANVSSEDSELREWLDIWTRGLIYKEIDR